MKDTHVAHLLKLEERKRASFQALDIRLKNIWPKGTPVLFKLSSRQVNLSSGIILNWYDGRARVEMRTAQAPGRVPKRTIKTVDWSQIHA